MKFPHLTLYLQDVSFSYNATLLLDKVVYSFSSGMIYAIIGPSGAGKTTLLRLLCGQLKSSFEGSIFVLRRQSNGAVLIEEQTRKNYISTISQDDALFSWRTVRENIQLACELGQNRYCKEECELKVRHAIAKFQLESYQDHYPHELSGGIKKLTALARVYVESRPILLLDEPFSAIDIFFRRKLYPFLRSLAEDEAKLVIIVSHDLYDCEQIADTTLLLAQAKLSCDIDIKSIIECQSVMPLDQVGYDFFIKG